MGPISLSQTITLGGAICAIWKLSALDRPTFHALLQGFIRNGTFITVKLAAVFCKDCFHCQTLKTPSLTLFKKNALAKGKWKHIKDTELHPIAEKCVLWHLCVSTKVCMCHFHKPPNSENYEGACGGIPPLAGCFCRKEWGRGVTAAVFAEGLTWLYLHRQVGNELASVKQYAASSCWAVFVAITRLAHSHTHRQWQLACCVSCKWQWRWYSLCKHLQQNIACVITLFKFSPSLLLYNVHIHVVFDRWVEKHHGFSICCWVYVLFL